jgi:hypothetical protein
MNIIDGVRRAFTPKRQFYPIGARVRVIRTVHLHELLGRTGTVIGPPHWAELPVKFLWWTRTYRWAGQYVAIDGLGYRLRNPVDGEIVRYTPSPDCIEPIEDGESAETQVAEALKRAARQKRQRVSSYEH